MAESSITICPFPLHRGQLTNVSCSSRGKNIRIEDRRRKCPMASNTYLKITDPSFWIEKFDKVLPADDHNTQRVENESEIHWKNKNNHVRHRNFAPAFISKKMFYVSWWKSGLRHRIGGPAVIGAWFEEFWVNGVRFEQDKYWEIVKKSEIIKPICCDICKIGI